MTTVTDEDFRELRYLAQRDAGRRLGRCIGKDRFETRGVAMQAITWRLQHDGVHPYRCPYCNAWHVGSSVGHGGWGGSQDKKQAGHQRHV